MNALDLIRMFEGYRDTPYWDVNAYRTGYGSDTVTLADGRVVPVAKGMMTTREDAERDLSRRVTTEFIPRVIGAVGEDSYKRLTEGQKAALASIAYNYGSLPHGVAIAVRDGDMKGAEAAIRALSTHNNGINADRRAKEADIFAGGRDAAPVAMAYANGRMTPEDAAIYERGMAEGVFPRAEKADALKAYAETAMRPRAPAAVTPLQFSAAQNATPLRGVPASFRGI